MKIQDWFPLELTGLISLQSKGLSRVFFNTTIWKHQFFCAQPSLWSNSHICTWVLEKIKDLTIQIFVGKAVSLLFNTLSRFVRAFLPRNKCLFISWQQLLSAAILQTSVPSPKGKVCPSEGCLGYWLWWCLLSLGGMANRVTEPNIVRTSPPLIREGVIPGSIRWPMSMVEVDTLDCVSLTPLWLHFHALQTSFTDLYTGK